MTTSLPAFARGAEPADDESRERARRIQLRFRFAEADDERLEPVGDLVPIHLYPWLKFESVRSDYPAVVWEDGGRVASLTSVVDGLVKDSGLDGDEKEYFRRSMHLLEAEIRRLVDSEGAANLREVWKAAVGALLDKLDSDERNRVAQDSARARERLDLRASVVPFGREAAIAFIEAAGRQVSAGRTSALADEVARLRDRLKALIEVDRSEGPEAHTPDALAQSIGDALGADFDLKHFSKLLEKAPHGPAIPPQRRERILEALAVLDVFLWARKAVADESFKAVSVTTRHQIHNHALAHRRLTGELVKALQTARLEAENAFDETTHERDLEALRPDLLNTSDLHSLPAGPVVINQRNLEALEPELRRLFDCGEPVKVVLLVESPLSSENPPAFEIPAGQRLLAGAGSDSAIFQVSLTQLDEVNRALREALAFVGPAFVAVYVGSEFGPNSMHPYLCAAAPHDARVFPSFRNNPSDGPTWADRFDADWNPSNNLEWAQSTVRFEDVDGREREEDRPFTAVDLMAMDGRFAAGFRRVSRDDWHDGMVPVAEFLRGARPGGLVPYILVADPEDGSLTRVICSDRIVNLTSTVARRWRALQELAGIENSHANRAVDSERSRIEEAAADRIEQVKAEFQADLDAKTGILAEQIVSNIAASLLGVELTKARPAPVRPSSPSTGGRDGMQTSDGEQAGLQDRAAAVEVEEEDEDEDEPISFDDPYIETPRCTTCDECTTINPRLFAYNENKQAYIADPSAGTFRELVLAAEKCPVKIIHPGKPRNPEEPRLDELMERAGAFN